MKIFIFYFSTVKNRILTVNQIKSKQIKMASKKIWTKMKLNITRDQIGLLVGKKGTVLFGDIQSPAREEYMKKVNEEGKIKLTYPNTNFKVEFPSETSKDSNVYVRWTCPRIIQKSDTMDRKVFDMIVKKHVLKVQSRILEIDESKSKMVKYEKTFRIRACTERRRVGMFIGNGGENVDKLKTSIKDILSLTSRVWIDILEDGDDEIEYMYDFDDDTDDSAWFTVKFNYIEDESINNAEVESIIEKFLDEFEDDEDDEELLDEEMIGEW